MQKFAHVKQLHIWIPSTHILNLQEIVSLAEAGDLLLSSESDGVCCTKDPLQTHSQNIVSLFITSS